MAEVFLCLGVFVDVSNLKFSGLVFIILEPVGPLKWNAQGIEIFIVDVDEYEDELERNICEVSSMRSSATCLITTQDQLVNLV